MDIEPFLSYVEQNLKSAVNEDSSSSSDGYDNTSNAGDDLSLTNVEGKKKMYN